MFGSVGACTTFGYYRARLNKTNRLLQLAEQLVDSACSKLRVTLAQRDESRCSCHRAPLAAVAATATGTKADAEEATVVNNPLAAIVTTEISSPIIARANIDVLMESGRCDGGVTDGDVTDGNGGRGSSVDIVDMVGWAGVVGGDETVQVPPSIAVAPTGCLSQEYAGVGGGDPARL